MRPPGRSASVLIFSASSAGCASIAQASRSITRQFPHTQVIGTPQEAARAGANGALIHNATLVIVIIALVLGAISVTNTMAMSVFERTRELGMLRAVGMTRIQVRRMIRHESVVTSLIGAALGLPLGIALAALVGESIGFAAFSLPVGQLIVFVIADSRAGVWLGHLRPRL